MHDGIQSAWEIAGDGNVREHAIAEFRIDDAIADVVFKMSTVRTDSEFVARIVDHAFSPPNCVSHTMAVVF